MDLSPDFSPDFSSDFSSAASGSGRGVPDDGPGVPPPPPSRQRTFVSVQGPGDLVAAVPYLVGFDPVRSVVVVSLRGPRRRCGLVARGDLPSPEQTGAWADALVGYVLSDRPREVVVLVHHDRP